MIQEFQGTRTTKIIEYDKSGAPADATVHLFGEEDGKMEKKKSGLNDGFFVVAYPEDFSGESNLEVHDDQGNVIDKGTITV